MADSIIQCPSCDRKLRVPDNLVGKKVKCPTCATMFTATVQGEQIPVAPVVRGDAPPSAPRRPPAREDDDRPGRGAELDDLPEEEYDEGLPEAEGRTRRRAGANRAEWAKVRLGVTLVLTSILVMILTIALGMIAGGAAAVAAASSRRSGTPPAAAVGGMFVVAILTRVLTLAAEGIALAGYVLCMNAPAKHGARTLAVTTVVLSGLAILLSLIMFVFSMTGSAVPMSPVGVAGAAGIGMVLGLVSSMLSFGKFFVFLFFLKALAKCMRAYALERSVLYLSFTYGAMFVCLLGTFVVGILVVGTAGFAASQGQPPAGAAGAAMGGGVMAMAGCSCVFVILGIASFIWYIIALVQTRTEIASYMARR